MSEIFKDGQAYLRVGENHKVRLPSEFVKFWNVKVGDELLIFKGKESVMLIPSGYKPTKRKHIRGKVTVSDHLLSMIDIVGPYICLVKTHVDVIEDFTIHTTRELRKLSQKHNFMTHRRQNIQTYLKIYNIIEIINNCI